jgi:hypothetical protein
MRIEMLIFPQLLTRLYSLDVQLHRFVHCTGFQYGDAKPFMAVMVKKFPSTRGSQACILDLVEKFLRLPLPACVAVR